MIDEATEEIALLLDATIAELFGLAIEVAAGPFIVDAPPIDPLSRSYFCAWKIVDLRALSCTSERFTN